MRCPKCHNSSWISDTVQLPLETVNKCYECGYWFDRAADGEEVSLCRFFRAYPDGGSCADIIDDFLDKS